MDAHQIIKYHKKQVRLRFKDGNSIKTAIGVLVDIESGFVKVTGDMGTIIINQKNVVKVDLF